MVVTKTGRVLTLSAQQCGRLYDRIAVCAHGITCEFCCWEWQGARSDNGYGRIRISHGVASAHVLAYAVAHGRMLFPGEQVLHTCDNPPCCQFHHLFMGTQRDNMADMWAKGRHPGAWPASRRLLFMHH